MTFNAHQIEHLHGNCPEHQQITSSASSIARTRKTRRVISNQFAAPFEKDVTKRMAIKMSACEGLRRSSAYNVCETTFRQDHLVTDGFRNALGFTRASVHLPKVHSTASSIMHFQLSRAKRPALTSTWNQNEGGRASLFTNQSILSHRFHCGVEVGFCR